MAAGTISVTSTDAANGSQLYATNQAVTTNIGSNTTTISTLQGEALLYSASVGAYDASHGGTDQKISNVAAGTVATDAANVGQVQTVATSTLNEAEGYSSQADATTLNSAEAYADSRSAQTLRDANAYTDWRVNRPNDQFNRRMARTGAAASALGLMAGTAASIHQDDTLAGAVTMFEGRPAAAFGVQHHFSDRVAKTIGASFAGEGQNAAGVAFAVGLHP